MNSLIIYLGYIYIGIGAIFLFIPIIYLELGRPKDLIKAFLNLLIGFIFIVTNNTINDSLFLIFFLLTLLVVLYVIDISLYRWHQLTDIEKKKLTTFMEFKKNVFKILEAINLGVRNFANLINFFNFGRNNQNTISKKWVRNDQNDNIKT